MRFACTSGRLSLPVSSQTRQGILTAALLLNSGLAAAITAEQQKMIERVEQLQRLEREEFLDHLGRARGCIVARDFTCTERSLGSAKKLVNSSRDKNELRLAFLELENERQTQAEEIERERRAQQEYEREMEEIRRKQERAEEEAREMERVAQQQARDAEDDDDGDDCRSRNCWVDDAIRAIDGAAGQMRKEMRDNYETSRRLQQGLAEANQQAEEKRREANYERARNEKNALAQAEASRLERERTAAARRQELARQQKEREQALLSEQSRRNQARQEQLRNDRLASSMPVTEPERAKSGPKFKYVYRDVTESVEADVMRCEPTREKALKYTEETLLNRMRRACEKIGDGWRYHGTSFPEGQAPDGPHGVPVGGYVGYRKCNYLGEGFVATIDNATHVCKKFVKNE